MSLHLLVGVIALIVDIVVIGALDAGVLYTSVESIDGFGGLQGATIAVEVIGFLLGVTVIVLWCTWFWRVRVNAESFSPGGIRYSSAMAVGSWFIPVCNLFMPKQVMNDVWSASNTAVPDWYGYGQRPPVRRGLVNTWWIFWLIYLCFFSANWDSWYDQSSISNAEESVAIAMFMDFFGIPASILAMVLVSRLTSMQDERLSGRGS
ncbi:hypothetical protein AN219_21655 [Streptomyces nanshensis]|nr:hypothetical protein AN219_21655 [Streptomyces nanshensis]